MTDSSRNISSPVQTPEAPVGAFTPTLYTALRALLRTPFFALSEEQNTVLQRRTLIDLALRGTIWNGVLLIAGLIVVIYGQPASATVRASLGGMVFTKAIWFTGLVIAALFSAVNLYVTASRVDTLNARSYAVLKYAWCAWLTAVIFWWFAGNWTLLPVAPIPGKFSFSQQTFIFMTVSGQAWTIILLAPEFLAVLCTLFIGLILPIWMYKSDLFATNMATIAVNWNTIQLSALAIAGVIAANDYRRSVAREITLGTQREKAEAERVRAEKAQKVAEEERHKAEAQRINAETAQRAAEAERVKAESEREKAEAERVRAKEAQNTAEEERRKAEAQRINAEAAQKAAEAERVKAESEREKADAERVRAKEAQNTAEMERGKAEAQRARAQEERERGDRFITAISHDLRQPLSTLSLKLDSIARRHKPDDGVIALTQNDLDQLIKQTESIETMIKGTLDLAQLQAGTWPINLSDPVALPLVMDSVLSKLRSDAIEKGVKLEVRSIPYSVKTDPVALERILRNLVGNAIRCTPAQSERGQGTVLVDAQLDHDTVKVSVVDNGIGIPPARKADIFKEYVQLENPERGPNKGLGLGLSIVQKLTKLLGHDLTVESKVGEGTTFTIFLPSLGRIPPALLAQPKSVVAPIANFEELVVLLVDDDEGPREGLRELLIDWECDVVDGESVPAVIEELRDRGIPAGPTVILSDYRLKDGWTGVEAVAALRKELGRPVPAAIWTAETGIEALQRIESGSLLRLSKPISNDALRSFLARGLNKAATSSAA